MPSSSFLDGSIAQTPFSIFRQRFMTKFEIREGSDWTEAHDKGVRNAWQELTTIKCTQYSPALICNLSLN